MARSLSALRFSSFFSAILSLYIVMAIVCICLANREVTPDVGANLATVFGNFQISILGVFNSIPLVVFSFMYQTNIPMIYVELEKKNLKMMKRIMSIGTVGATILYTIAGTFGYAAFANNEQLATYMDKQNILQCYPKGNIPNYISLFGILTVVLFATPLTILPCKDTIEELFLKPGEKLSSRQNVYATFVLVLVSFGIAAPLASIGDAMTILGATTNTLIGFLLPIIYYLKLEEKAPRWAPHKIVCYVVFVVSVLSSIIELSTFIYKKTST